MAFISTKNNFWYNKVKYEIGQPIPDFGIGKYDDLLLDRGDVVNNGVSDGRDTTGLEERIAKQKQRRAEMWTDYDSMVREEEQFSLDYAKYDGDREVEARQLG